MESQRWHLEIQHQGHRPARLEHAVPEARRFRSGEGPRPRRLPEDVSPPLRIFRQNEERHGGRHPGRLSEGPEEARSLLPPRGFYQERRTYEKIDEQET